MKPPWQLVTSPAAASREAITGRVTTTWACMRNIFPVGSWEENSAQLHITFRAVLGHPELHWNGTKLVNVETMLEWAKSMTWKGLSPCVELSRKAYQKGVALSRRAMQGVEARQRVTLSCPNGIF